MGQLIQYHKKMMEYFAKLYVKWFQDFGPEAAQGRAVRIFPVEFMQKLKPFVMEEYKRKGIGK